jgi:exopolysaccharide biosynthesis polyprenyl glycosylphosphotransferase
MRIALGVVLVADALVIVAAVWFAWQMRVAFDIWSAELVITTWPTYQAGWWVTLLWLAILGAQGAYVSRTFGAGPEEFRVIGNASIIAGGVVGTLCYVLQLPLSRGFVVLAFALGTPLLLLERYLARKVLHSLRRHNHLTHRVIAVGEAAGIAEVVGVLERENYVGYRVVGASLSEVGAADGDLKVPILGPVDRLRELCDANEIDTVLVARGGFETSATLRRITWELEDSPIELIVVPSLTDVASPRIQMRPVAGLPLLHVEHPTAREAGGLPKRAFDVGGSMAILLLISPLLIVLGLIVKLQDRGPVFFKQARVGRHGETFHMIKFRSMVVDAEAKLAEISHLNESDGILFKVKSDPRITSIGRFLRKFSLDELPQLLNVLGGSMSLVGPRPPLATEVEQYGSDTHRRLAVRPGMTGLWQVSGRSELSWEESVRLDLYYVDNWSLMSDLVIIAKTVKAVVAGSGAY